MGLADGLLRGRSDEQRLEFVQQLSSLDFGRLDSRDDPIKFLAQVLAGKVLGWVIQHKSPAPDVARSP